jgi:hypothetical protein
MASLKLCPKTYLEVVEDSLCNKAEIEQGNDVEIGSQNEKGGIDMETFVFIEYEDVAEPDTDPEGNKHGNSEENDTTNSMFKMPEILKIKGKVIRSQLTALNP